MSGNDEQNRKLAGDLRSARDATLQLAGQLRRFNRRMASATRQVAAGCAGGACPAEPEARTMGTDPAFGRSGDSRAMATVGSLAADIGKSLSVSVNSVLRNLMSGIGKSLGGLIKRQSGGGIFGGLLGGLVGGGLDLLAGKLFPKRQRVEVENTVAAQIMNFPRLSDLGYATNPASRLLGGRATARGPAFTVTLDYRNGAEDLIAARLTNHLMELNELQGRN